MGAFRALLLRDAFENYRVLESRFVIARDVTKLFLDSLTIVLSHYLSTR